MGARTTGSVVVDAGGLIALERGDRTVFVLLSQAAQVVVPAGVVAQVWRGSARQARIAAVLAASNTTIEALDGTTARAAGVLCGGTGTSDVVDATVALAGHVHGALVITSDPDDIAAIAPGLDLHVC